MTTYPYCNTFIGTAPSCPRCGAPAQRAPQPPLAQATAKKKSKMPLIIVVIVVVAVLVLASVGVVLFFALSGNDTADEEDNTPPYVMTMTADKTEVTRDESVNLTITLTNNEEEDFPAEGKFLDIAIIVKSEFNSGAYGYHSSPDGVPEDTVENTVVPPGESVTLELEWKMSNRDPDNYVIVLSLNKIIREEEDYLESLTLRERTVSVEVIE